MKKYYPLLAGLTVFTVILLVSGPRARAESPDYPHATSYYDDLVDHYEHDQLTRDEIAKGI